MAIRIEGGVLIEGGIIFNPPGEPPTPTGADLYEAGTYTWTAPPGVHFVSVVCIGGGEGGHFNSSFSLAYSGGGGGCGWKNNIPVTPGQSYTVVVGGGGNAGYKSGATYIPANPGGNSYFINTGTVKGGGGGQAGAGQGGNYVGDGGGNGGSAGATTSSVGSGGAGGAGGYTGNGGNGGATNTAGTAGAGSGGGGGGGGTTGFMGGGGGGVNPYGLPNGTGKNGTAGPIRNGGGGTNTGSNQNLYGYGGTDGTSGEINYGGIGGYYGAGCAGTIDLGTGQYAYRGAQGAVRIIYGDNRAFPATLAYNVGGETNH
jgi:hypothetical protein